MKPTVSRDTPCLSITSVARDRLQVFGKDPLKNFTTSLAKLRDARKARGHSLRDGHSNVLLMTSEEVFMQRVNYIRQNPARAGLVERAEGWWSSARCWRGEPQEDEPLMIDLETLIWRKPRQDARRRSLNKKTE
jgi:hypothetical protein